MKSPAAPQRAGYEVLAVLALAVLLFFLPALVGLGWRLVFPGAEPNTFFVPVEILGVLLPTLMLSAGTRWRESLRWRPVAPRRLLWAALGAAGWAGGLSYVQTIWEKVSGFGPPPGLAELLAIRSPGDLAWLVAGAVLMPALCEESAFRGFTQLRLETYFGRIAWLQRLGPWPAIAISTALFATFHHDGYGIPTYLGMGAFLGWTAWRSGSLLPAAVAHATNNLLALAQMNGLSEAWWWANAAWLAPLSGLLAALATYMQNRD